MYITLESVVIAKSTEKFIERVDMPSAKLFPAWVSHAYQVADKRCQGLVEGTLHVLSWAVVLILEISFHTTVRDHVEELKMVNEANLQTATVDAYEAISDGAMGAGVASASLVVLLLLHHYSYDHDKFGAPQTLLGLVEGAIKASILFNVVTQMIFLCEDRYAMVNMQMPSAINSSHVKTAIVWVGEPRLWTALIAFKLLAIGMLRANLRLDAVRNKAYDTETTTQVSQVSTTYPGE